MSELEERLSALEEMVLDTSIQTSAMDLAIRALIATHPDRALCAQVLSAVLSNHEHVVRDFGFDRGKSATSARAISSRIAEHVQRWLQVARSD
jgi:hypothetical protein